MLAFEGMVSSPGAAEVAVVTVAEAAEASAEPAAVALAEAATGSTVAAE